MSGKALARSMKQIACEVCGCTAIRACPGGCAWSPFYLALSRAVCTGCERKAPRTGPRVDVRELERQMARATGVPANYRFMGSD